MTRVTAAISRIFHDDYLECGMDLFVGRTWLLSWAPGSILIPSFPASLAFLACLACLTSAAAYAGPVEDLGAWLKTARASRPALASQAFATVSLSAAESGAARDLLWADRLDAIKTEGASEWAAKTLVDAENLKMPFDYRIRGPKPAAGYDLYISMHGGGETDKATNDGQWQNQILLYQPDGIYLAPRAPTDTWNMWFRGHIDGFFDRIIRLCVANLGANPNRVYLMGYSAGGDGVYQLAPRMADRWAAAAMMAGHPNDASPVNLRNIGFTMHVGALDAAFNRNTIAVAYGKAIQKLQDADPGYYKYDVQVHAGKPHWMDLEDKAALPWMAAFTRRPLPAKVVWKQDATVAVSALPATGSGAPVPGAPTQSQFHWIGLPAKKALGVQAQITAEIRGQDVDIAAANVDSLVVHLNDSLLDLDKPVRVSWKGRVAYQGVPARTIANLWRSLQERADRDYAFPARLLVNPSMQAGLAERGVEPKPAVRVRGGILHAVFPSEQSGALRILDVTGAVRASSAVRRSSAAEIPLDGLRPGVHFLQLPSRRDGSRPPAMRIFIP